MRPQQSADGPHRAENGAENQRRTDETNHERVEREAARDERHGYAQRENGETVDQRAAAGQQPKPILATSHGRAVEQRMISRVCFDRAHGMPRAELLLGGGCRIQPLTGVGMAIRAGFRAFPRALFFALRGVEFAADCGDVHARRRQP